MYQFKFERHPQTRHLEDNDVLVRFLEDVRMGVADVRGSLKILGWSGQKIEDVVGDAVIKFREVIMLVRHQKLNDDAYFDARDGLAQTLNNIVMIANRDKAINDAREAKEMEDVENMLRNLG